MNIIEKYQDERAAVYQEDGIKYPGKTLANMELVPGHTRAKTTLLPYIRLINETHLIMLQEQGIVSKKEASSIMKVLQTLDYDAYRNSTYSGQYEDLYFEMEAEIIKKTDGAGGNLHLSRSRNDMCLAWSHLVIRDELLELIELLIRLQNTVRLFAEEHKDTLYVIHTHTQHAQPGVFGHYFLAFADVIDRNVKRLQAAYAAANCSPMGAAAITTSGYDISRERVAELCGFDSVIENSYDAIGNCDYFTQTASVIGLMALDLGRVVTDLVMWATEEMKMIRVADGYISISSIMPQKRNPIALEHLRSSLSIVKGLADSVQLGFMKSPYGDISDYEDIEDTLSGVMNLTKLNINIFNSVIATMDVNKELLRERAFESFSVVTEIADQMYRSYGIPFRRAHSFVAFLVKKAGETNYNLKNVSIEFFSAAYEEFFGEAFTMDYTPIVQSIDPQHFVDCRETLGGTGKQAMAAMLASALTKVQINADWLAEKNALLKLAEKKKEAAIKKIIDEA